MPNTLTKTDSQKKASLTMDPLAYYMHQDNAMWRAIIWAIPIEGGVITGAFKKPGWPGLLLAILGLFLIFALSIYAWKSYKDREVNSPLIDRLKPRGFFRGYPTKHRVCKGGFWLCLIFGVMMLVNFLILGLEVCELMEWLQPVTSKFFKPSCS